MCKYAMLIRCICTLRVSEEDPYKDAERKHAKFKKLPFCQKIILRHQRTLCKYSMCLHCVCNVSGDNSKTFSTSTTYISNPKPYKQQRLKTLLRLKSCRFVKIILVIKLYYEYLQLVHSVNTKYQIPTTRTMVQVEFSMHALSELF